MGSKTSVSKLTCPVRSGVVALRTCTCTVGITVAGVLVFTECKYVWYVASLRSCRLTPSYCLVYRPILSAAVGVTSWKLPEPRGGVPGPLTKEPVPSVADEAVVAGYHCGLVPPGGLSVSPVGGTGAAQAGDGAGAG